MRKQVQQKRTARKAWSQTDLDKLQKWVGKRPVEQIAAALSRTPSAVRQKMFELGLRIRTARTKAPVKRAPNKRAPTRRTPAKRAPVKRTPRAPVETPVVESKA